LCFGENFLMQQKLSLVGRFAQRAQRGLARVPLGAGRRCCLCGRRVGRFLPYRGGWAGAPPLMRVLKIVGSDLDRYGCPVCGCNDRERHLALYFRELGLFEKVRGSAVLHFAPEPKFGFLIAQAGPSHYVRADLTPAAPEIEKIDMLAIPYAEGSFDLVIANHVLEHVADDTKALSELHRVLRPGGLAILQTPYSSVLDHSLSDLGVTTEEARLQLFGQEDHVRLYGRGVFASFAAAGFVSRVVRHEEALPAIDAKTFGVNRDEPLFLFERR
jgi:SAM-dependent methyltransferase